MLTIEKTPTSLEALLFGSVSLTLVERNILDRFLEEEIAKYIIGNDITVQLETRERVENYVTSDYSIQALDVTMKVRVRTTKEKDHQNYNILLRIRSQGDLPTLFTDYVSASLTRLKEAVFEPIEEKRADFFKMYGESH